MNILVTAASRQGSTAEIARAIADSLRARGHETTVASPDESVDVAPYDAFVIGSAIYAGHWLAPATAFVRRFAPTLARRPVWLFSSGPVGDPRRRLVQKMTSDPVELVELIALTNAREHRIFAGRLESQGLSGLQRLSLFAFRGIEGDWRDWTAIERWTNEIADQIARTNIERPVAAG